MSVVAFSTDPLEKAQETVAQLHLTFPVGYDLVVPRDANRIGADWDEGRGVIQPSEFLLGPQGKVLHTTYSSGPIGRIAASDLVRMVTFLEKARQENT